MIDCILTFRGVLKWFDVAHSAIALRIYPYWRLCIVSSYTMLVRQLVVGSYS